MSKNKELANKLDNANGKARSPATQINEFFGRMAPEMQKVLPKHLTPERLTRVAITVMQKTPRLYECELSSLAACIMKSAELGLDPSLPNQCHYVPYKNGKKSKAQNRPVYEATFIAGYQGLITLALRSGHVAMIAAATLHENDLFEWEEGFNAKLRIVPRLGNRGPLIGACAWAILVSGEKQSCVMDKDQIDEIKNRSRAKDTTWKTDYEEMCRKTPIRRLCKSLPVGIDAQAAFAQFDANEFSEPQAIEINSGVKNLENGGTWPAIEESELPEAQKESYRVSAEGSALEGTPVDSLSLDDIKTTLGDTLQLGLLTKKDVKELEKRMEHLEDFLEPEDASEHI